MTVETSTAKSIVEVAISGGFWTEPLPEGEKLIETAGYLYDEAVKAHDTPGMDFPEIEQIMRLGGWEPPITDDDKLSSSEGQEGSSPRGVDEGSPAQEQQVLQGPDPSYGLKPDPILRENLPIPDEIEGDPIPMPRDISSLDDREIRRLTGEQNAFLTRVTWLLSLRQGDLRNAEHLRQAAWRKKVLEFKSEPDETGKSKTMSQAEKEADSHPEVQMWDDQVLEHQNTVDSFKALKEIYKGNVERLSREASMRQDEWLRGGGKR